MQVNAQPSGNGEAIGTEARLEERKMRKDPSHVCPEPPRSLTQAGHALTPSQHRRVHALTLQRYCFMPCALLRWVNALARGMRTPGRAGRDPDCHSHASPRRLSTSHRTFRNRTRRPLRDVRGDRCGRACRHLLGRWARIGHGSPFPSLPDPSSVFNDAKHSCH